MDADRGHLTHEAIRAAVVAKREQATKSAPDWDVVLEVLEDLEQLREAAAPLLGEPWTLARVELSGIRGIPSGGDPLVLSLSPEPGLTLIVGENGAGKTSITDGIHVALGGQPLEDPDFGRGFTREIWAPLPVNSDAQDARCRVELARAGDELVVTCDVAADGEVSIVATLNGVEVGTAQLTAWTRLFDDSHPVFAYGTVARQLRSAEDMLTFLAGLLELGPELGSLISEIGKRAAVANDANKTWNDASARLLERIEAVDRKWIDLDVEADPIDPPALSDDIDAWRERHRAQSGTASIDVHLPEARVTSILQAAAETRTAQAAAANQPEKHRDQYLRGELRALLTAAESLETTGDDCPVCTSQAPWVDRLTSVLDHLPPDNALDRALNEKVAKLVRETAALLPLASEGSEGHVPHATAATRLVALIVDLHDTSGAEQRAVLDDVLEALLTKYGEALRTIAATSDFRARWLEARQRAMDDFVEEAADAQELARTNESWSRASTLAKQLADDLRASRLAAMETRLAELLTSLLGPAGPQLDGIRPMSRQVDLSLSRSGAELTPGMLSDGQRNALLLAPVLATVGSATFGFVVLDDPVHAFDELRIDQLARELARLSDHLQVVILTHDRRLEELLRATSSRLSVRTIAQSADGSTALTPRPDVWQVLIDDAEALTTADWDGLPVSMHPNHLAYGLARQAVDEAIRQLVLTADGGGIIERIELLDDVKLAPGTKTRLRAARSLVGEAGRTTIEGILSSSSPVLKRVNSCTHDPRAAASVTCEVAAQDLGTVRLICEKLTRSHG